MTTNVCFGGPGLRPRSPRARQRAVSSGPVAAPRFCVSTSERRHVRYADRRGDARSVSRVADPLAESRSSRSPASGRARSRACCCRTWAPTSCGSTARRQVNPADFGQAESRAALPRPAFGRRRPEEPRGRRDGAPARGARRRAVRGLPAGRDRAARSRPRRVPRPQPEARVRAYDRLGPGRPDGAGRGPRHQLHRARRARSRTSVARAASRRRRSTSSATSAAAACSWRFGIVCGVLEAQRSGKGQVIDVAMVDGTATLMSMMWGF